MNLPKAYIKGFAKAGKSPRLIFILYLSNLFTALLLAMPFKDFLERSFGNSKLSENLLDGFDFTVFSNLFHYNTSGVFAILGSIKWLLLAYFLLSMFLTGGIIRVLNRDKFSNSAFFSGATFNFFRFVGLGIIILFFQILFLLAVYVPLNLIIDSLQQKFVSEITYYYWIGGAIILHLFIFLLISIIGDYAKFYLELKNSFNIFKAFWKGIKYVFSHFFKTYFLYLILLFLPAVIMYVYLYFESDIKMATGIGILIVLAMQQVFVLLRVFLRIWILASQFKMYDDDFTETREIEKDEAFSKFKPEPPAKSKKQKKVKVENLPPVVEEQEEAEIEEQKNDSTNQKTGYEIDFDKTFSDENKVDSDEPTLTEDEMIEKVKYEEQQDKWLQDKGEEKILRKEEEVYDEEIYVEPPENNKSSFEEDDTDEKAESEQVVYEIIEEEDELDVERVQQVVTNGILHSNIGVEE